MEYTYQKNSTKILAYLQTWTRPKVLESVSSNHAVVYSGGTVIINACYFLKICC